LSSATSTARKASRQGPDTARCSALRLSSAEQPSQHRELTLASAWRVDADLRADRNDRGPAVPMEQQSALEPAIEAQDRGRLRNGVFPIPRRPSNERLDLGERPRAPGCSSFASGQERGRQHPDHVERGLEPVKVRNSASLPSAPRPIVDAGRDRERARRNVDRLPNAAELDSGGGGDRRWSWHAGGLWTSSGLGKRSDCRRSNHMRLGALVVALTSCYYRRDDPRRGRPRSSGRGSATRAHHYPTGSPAVRRHDAERWGSVDRSPQAGPRWQSPRSWVWPPRDLVVGR
jgi:hypothetical protein